MTPEQLDEIEARAKAGNAIGAFEAAGIIAQSRELREALDWLVTVIDKAGVTNLMNGVQLGAISWSVKANAAMDNARRALTGASE